MQPKKPLPDYKHSLRSQESPLSTKKKLQAYKKLKLFRDAMSQLHKNTQATLNIRRLLPVRQTQPDLVRVSTPYQLIQTNSYFNSRKSSLQSKNLQTLDEFDASLNVKATHGLGSQNNSPLNYSCKQIIQISNQLLRTRSITQKIVIINHQGKPTTYYKK